MKKRLNIPVGIIVVAVLFLASPAVMADAASRAEPGDETCLLVDARADNRNQNKTFRERFFRNVFAVKDHVFIVTRRIHRDPPSKGRGLALVDSRQSTSRDYWEAQVLFPSHHACGGKHWVRADDSLTADTRVVSVGDGWLLAIYKDKQLVQLTDPARRGETHWRIVKDLMLNVPHGYYETSGRSGSSGNRGGNVRSRRAEPRRAANQNRARPQPQRARPQR